MRPLALFAGLFAAAALAPDARSQLALTKPKPPANAKPADLNAKVLQYARDRVGKKVLRGECAELAVEALRAAGAKTTHDFGVSGDDADYKWGTLVKSRDDAKPGDIIQYRNVTTKSTVTTKIGNRTSTRTSSQSFPHHTAIVAENLGGGRLKVLEQNVGGANVSEEQKRRVQAGEVNLASQTGGSVWIYRPVKK